MVNVPFSCPYIDDAIDNMEKVREINKDLRKECDRLEALVSTLEIEIEELKDEIADLKSEIKAMDYA